MSERMDLRSFMALYEEADRHEAIQAWFGLTYANYLVLPRVVLQAMPDAWQEEFVRLLRELEWAADDLPLGREYRVNVVERGRYARDDLPHYRRGAVQVRPTR